jgi:hypothetical protein
VEIVLPSANATMSSESVISTPTGEGVFSSVTEKLIPRLQELVLSFFADPLNRSQLG